MKIAAPLKKSIPLYQQAYLVIKKSILSGVLKPGAKLVENELAEQLNISRTPLREALRQLQQEGLLVIDNISTSVIEITEKDFKELCSLRLLLEKEVIKLVISNIRDEQITALDLLMQMSTESLGDLDYLEVSKVYAKYHEILDNACLNARLTETLQHVRSLLLLYRVNALKLSENYEIIQEHQMILDAIKQRDLRKAIKAIELHDAADFKRGMKIFQKQSDS